jgi:hypothetical protein
MVNWLRSSLANEEMRNFVPFSVRAVALSGGIRWVRYWNIDAWMMLGGKRFLEGRHQHQQRRKLLKSQSLLSADLWLTTHLTKSKSVSAVSTSRVTFSPSSMLASWPSPGRMIVTKMMPKMAAQTVVVKW